MRNLLGIICFLCTGAGQILLVGLILACLLPEKWAEYIGAIIAIPFLIALIVLFVKFIANFIDLIKGKY